jgi:biofilm PGA synthesis N-glycosyltransferase PgaC
MSVLYSLVIFCWIIALMRLLIGSVASDLLIIKQDRRRFLETTVTKKRKHLPSISILIPAYNEELTIIRTIQSVLACDYPASKVEIIVVNDGSKDTTKDVVRAFKKNNKTVFKIRLINKPNSGKARSLNYVLKRYARNNLILCLDADTTLAPNALRNGAQYFRDRNTVALACYADIIEDNSVLALTQRIEYIIGYRTKSAYTQLGVNYIIPGTGSLFRHSILKRVNYYESNTLTEDLDLTLKIMIKKNRREKISYARDVVAYTEAVHSLKELLVQRYRWTYGRAQVFTKYDKRLSWGALPFTLIQDLSFLVSPIVTGYFIYYSIRYQDLAVLSGGIIILSVYLTLSIWSVEHLNIKEKIRLSFYAPPMYVLIYLTAFAEYYALLRAIVSLPKLKASLKKRHVTWSSPERIAVKS